MNIDKAIKQKAFKNEHQKAMVNMIYTSNWIHEKQKLIFEPHDITPQQFNILRILRGSKSPLSTMDIRDRMLDKNSDSSRMVVRLERKKLVDKSINSKDQRLLDVTISKRGLELLSRLDLEDNQLIGIISNLTTEEAKTLNTLLDKIRHNK